MQLPRVVLALAFGSSLWLLTGFPISGFRALDSAFLSSQEPKSQTAPFQAPQCCSNQLSTRHSARPFSSAPSIPNKARGFS